jgi:hypothetical protein
MQTCHKCDVPVGQTNRVKCEPCGHCMCLHCSIDVLFETKYKRHFVCCCGRKVDRHSYDRPVATNKRTRGSEHAAPTIESIVSVHKEISPNSFWVELQDGLDYTRRIVQYLSSLPVEARRDKIGNEGLLCTQQCRIYLQERDQVRVEKSALSTLRIGKDTYFTNRSIRNLTQIFANFHKILILNQSSTTIHDDNDPMSVENLITYILQTDKRVLPRVIFSLATGHIDYSKMRDRKDITQQSALLSSYLATDIITRLRNPKKEVGHAVRAVTLAIENYSESSFRDLLSMCRVSSESFIM